MIWVLWLFGWLITVGLVKEHLESKGKMSQGFQWLIGAVVLIFYWPFVLIATLWSRWKNK